MKPYKLLKHILDEAEADPQAKISFDQDGFRIMFNDVTYQVMELPTERCYQLAIKAGHNKDKIEMIRKLHHDNDEEFNLKTVKISGLSLKFIKKQTPQICLEALKQNSESLDYVKIVDFLDLDDCIKKLQNKIKLEKLI